MFHRLPKLDQSKDALTACYGYGGAPKQRSAELYAGRTLDWRVLAFGRAARQGIHLADLAQALLEADPAELTTSEARIEYTWFLFSQKAWPQLKACVEGVAEPGVLPAHIADLYFLTFYRLQAPRFLGRRDSAGFARDAETCLGFLARFWPAERLRLELFQAIVENSIGDRMRAREAMVRLSPQVDLVVALGAARCVLPHPVVSREPVQSIDIHAANSSAATLLSVDRAYFERYGRHFLVNHARSNPGRAVHFHCVGFDPVPHLRAWNSPVPTGHTIDETDIAGLPHLGRIGYFSCARYRFLREYLGPYQDVLVSDIDGVLMRDASRLVAERQAADVLLQTTIMQPDRRLINMPWAAIPAPATLVKRTPGGLRFADYMRSYIEENLARTRRGEGQFWYTDQVALYYAWHDLHDEVAFEPYGHPMYRQGGDWTLFSGDDAKLRYLVESR